MGNNTIIKFSGIFKKYDDKAVLSNISFDVDRGEFITIIGSSGSGKTTMLKMINGLILPDSGDIYVNNENINNLDLIKLRRSIGYSIQNIGLFPHLTNRKNILYVKSLEKHTTKEEKNNIINKMIDILDLDESILDRYPSELSGGQQQRIGIARALAANPSILLMDEPFGAVDEITRKSLQNEILNIHRNLGTTILFVTHDINEALRLGTKIMIMNNGHIEQFDKPDIVIDSPASEYVKILVNNNKNCS